ncbi:hypothetical protein LP414_11695 [Polaromonas sp. P1(28)-13]|nr:hypothetical protein LP414_11695 [Polaromonas sp. P1(28)-13]
MQDAGDPGIPGVRIYLEDGTYAVTDEEGKYSFYGLEPRTHVAKVDGTTLPVGATLQVLNNRNAMDAASRFVDLTHGELHKADFAIAECTPGIHEQIAARRKALVSPSEIVQAAAALLSSNRAAGVTDARTLPSSGTMSLPGAPKGKPGSTVAPPVSGGDAPLAGALGAVGDVGGPYAPAAQGLPKPLYTPSSALLESAQFATGAASRPAEPADSTEPGQISEPLEELLPALSPEVGFIGLRDDQVLPTDQTWVRVKGPLGAMFELTVNGQVVPASQVGKKSSLEKNGGGLGIHRCQPQTRPQHPQRALLTALAMPAAPRKSPCWRLARSPKLRWTRHPSRWPMPPRRWLSALPCAMQTAWPWRRAPRSPCRPAWGSGKRPTLIRVSPAPRCLLRAERAASCCCLRPSPARPRSVPAQARSSPRPPLNSPPTCGP